MSASALGKDIKNYTCTIQYAALEFSLNISLLARTERMVEQNNICLMQRYCILNLFKLAFPHKKPGAGLLSGTGHNSNRFNPGGTYKLPELFRIFSTVVRRKFDVDEYRSLTYIRAIKQWASTPLNSVY